MAWELSVVLALIGLAGLFLFLAKVFGKEQRGIKMLLIMFSLGSCVLIAQILRIVVDENTQGSTLTNLQSMTTVILTLTIVIFIFFMAYYFVIYTIEAIRGLRDSKKKRRFGEDAEEI